MRAVAARACREYLAVAMKHWAAAALMFAVTTTLSGSGCAHSRPRESVQAGSADSRTREGALAAATHALACGSAELLLTEYSETDYYASIEGCNRQAHFAYLDGNWRLTSRCEVRTTPSIPSYHSPNRGGERTCVAECRGLEECAAMSPPR